MIFSFIATIGLFRFKVEKYVGKEKCNDQKKKKMDT